RRTMQGREEGRDAMSAARIGAKQENVESNKSFICDDAHRDVQLVKNLYESLIEAKRNCGEPIENFSFPRFHRLVASKAAGLKEKFGCKRVEFLVAVEGGHVSFRARADGE